MAHIFSVCGFDAGNGVDHDDGGVGGDERGAGVVDEHIEAGGIEDIDLGLLPLDGGDARWRWSACG